MGRFKRLKEEHENLKEDVAQLVETLKSEGSLDAHCSMCTQHIGGQHGFRIDKNRMNIMQLSSNVERLEKFLGVELKHTDKWEYEERENTDE